MSEEQLINTLRVCFPESTKSVSDSCMQEHLQRGQWYAETNVDGEMVGCVQMDKGNIFSLCTMPVSRHKGVATRLLNRVIHDIEEAGMVPCLNADHIGLVPFYEKFGFTRTKNLTMVKMPKKSPKYPIDVRDAIIDFLVVTLAAVVMRRS